MSKKRKRSPLEIIVNNNHAKDHQVVVKKKFHKKDLKYVSPITKTQHTVAKAFAQGMNLFLHGSAGTGKTFLSMYLALSEVLDNDTQYDRLIVVRSAVASRDIGFLKGTEEEKLAVYEQPYIAICDELIHYGKSYENMKKSGYIEFMSSSYLRGLTFDRAIILVDEVQNMTYAELNTIMTRIGINTKVIFAGDTAQNDLTKNRYEVSGLVDFMNIINTLDEFTTIKFSTDDIVRSELVKKYIIAKELYESD